MIFVITILVTNLILGLVTKKDVQIPDLVGKEQTIAQSEVEGLKLKYKKGSEEYNKDIPAGYIISQDPTYMPNYKIKEGSTITVVVSLGSNTVKMEKVVGLTQEEAKSKLEALGLKVSIEEVYDNKVEAGYVVEQSVKENEEIDAGETINLKVSKGIEKVTVPDLLGKTEDEAKELYVRIQNGESFTELAEEYSLCPSKQNGGDLGFFGKGMMVAPFEKAALELEVGDVSEPVQTQFGWHLIYLTGKN